MVNLHASARVELAEAELRHVWERALRWASDDPLIVAGDFNLRDPGAPREDIVHLASRDVDHIFARGLHSARDPQLLDRHIAVGLERVELSDHVPLLAPLFVHLPAGAGLEHERVRTTVLLHRRL